MNRRDFTLGGMALCGIAGLQGGGAAAQRTSPAILRRLRNLQGETVNLRDYCAANGRQVDTQVYQELLDLQPAKILYPADARLVIDRPIQLRSDQSHLFAEGAAIDSEVDGFAMIGTGETGQNLGDLVEPIPRYSRTITLDRRPEVSAGDLVVLADVADPKWLKADINLVERVTETTITTKYDIGRPFQDPASFRIYHLYKPVRNVSLLGRVVAENHSKSGGFLRFVNASGIDVRGLTIRDTGYIGISFESSLNGQFRDIVIRGAGASGLGFRAAKAITVDGFVAENVRADESLTFYDNVSHAEVTNLAIRQYLYGERRPGQSAGNNILIDLLCSRINVSNVNCVGSATYNFVINNQSDYCSLDNFALRRSNLGGIRISRHSHNARIGRGVIADVVDKIDSEASGKPVSAISVGKTCTGASIGKAVSFERIGTGINIAAWQDA